METYIEVTHMEQDEAEVWQKLRDFAQTLANDPRFLVIIGDGMSTQGVVPE